MAILAQHGYAKSDKIDQGLKDQAIKGAIFSPRDEDPERLSEYLRALRDGNEKAKIYFDPQVFAATIPNAREGHLPEYPYYKTGLNRRSFVSPSNVAELVDRTLSYQRGLPVSGLLTPAVPIDDLQDQWSFISLSLIEASIAWRERQKVKRSLYASLLISETALRSEVAVNEFLDTLSLFKVDGFYLVIDRTKPDYNQTYNSDSLKGLLNVVYTLGAVNEFRVICGFSDFSSLLLHAVGARYTACGWHNGLRQFCMESRFMPRTSGGRRPRPRYASKQLLNSILINPELAAIESAGLGNQVFSKTPYDGDLRKGPLTATWPESQSTLHHWHVLSSLVSEIEAAGSWTQRLDLVQQKLDSATKLYAQLQRRIPFEASSGPAHLAQWATAISEFRKAASI